MGIIFARDQARRALRSALVVRAPPAGADPGRPEVEADRLRSDDRRLSDLHLAYISRWTAWSHAHGSLSRNQAHGAPGNLLDLYAAADIPETESFGPIDERQVPLLGDQKDLSC